MFNIICNYALIFVNRKDIPISYSIFKIFKIKLRVEDKIIDNNLSIFLRDFREYYPLIRMETKIIDSDVNTI